MRPFLCHFSVLPPQTPTSYYLYLLSLSPISVRVCVVYFCSHFRLSSRCHWIVREHGQSWALLLALCSHLNSYT